MTLSPLLRLLVQTQAKQGATAMAALAVAQRVGSQAADPERLTQLLSRYGDDVSPVIDAARRLHGSGQSTMN